MEINFYITEQSVNDMSAEDYEAFERAQDGEIKMYRLRPAICRFMVDEHNQPVPYEQALKLSGKMKVIQYKDFIQKFFETMNNATVPKVNGSSSKSPTEVELEVSPSLPG